MGSIVPRRRRRVDPLDQNDRFKRDIRDTYGKVRPKRDGAPPGPARPPEPPPPRKRTAPPSFPQPGAVALRLSAPAARLLRERGLERREVLARPRVRAAANERGVVDYAALKAILDRS